MNIFQLQNLFSKSSIGMCLLSLIALVFASAHAKDRIPFAVLNALNDPETITVYSISSSRSPTGSGFRGYPIISYLKVSDDDNLQVITSSIKADLDTASGGAFCFLPHHALRILKSGRFFDFVICYKCQNYEFYSGSTYQTGGAIGGSPEVLNRYLGKTTDTAEQGAAANP